MSPTMAMTMPTAMYAPTSDVMDRHEYGITKSRKSSSTGGGRAWSEDEVRGLLRCVEFPRLEQGETETETSLLCVSFSEEVGGAEDMDGCPSVRNILC